MLSKIIHLEHQLYTKIISLKNIFKFILLLIVAMLFGVIILKINIMTQMFGDDFLYSFVFDSDKRVVSFNDILYSQYRHYVEWGGRVVAHVIAQQLLSFPALVIDILNTLVYILYTLIIYFHIKGTNKRHSISLYILINLFIWFLLPEYSQTILWITGSANYLWCTLIILGFLLPYRLYNINRIFSSSITHRLFSCIGMFLFGIIAGWTNENVAFAMILMIILWFFYYKKQRKVIPLWAIFGLIGSVIGYILLISAPGNFVRLETTDSPEINLFLLYFKFNMYTARLVLNVGPVILLSLILTILVLKFSSLSRRNYLYIIMIYVIGMFAATYSMILSPTFPNRAWFGLMSISFIIVGISYYNLDYKINFIRYIRSSIFVLFVVAFPFSFYKHYKEIKLTNKMWNERHAKITTAIRENEPVVEVSSIRKSSKYTMDDVPLYSLIMSKYYDIEIKMD